MCHLLEILHHNLHLLRQSNEHFNFTMKILSYLKKKSYKIANINLLFTKKHGGKKFHSKYFLNIFQFKNFKLDAVTHFEESIKLLTLQYND